MILTKDSLGRIAFLLSLVAVLGNASLTHAQWNFADESLGPVYQEPRQEDSAGSRVPGYIIGTLGGYSAAALSGLTIGGVVLATTKEAGCKSADEFCGTYGIMAALFSTGMSAPFWLAGGIHLGGDLSGGNGNYGTTLVGTLAGTALAAASAYGFASLDDEDVGPALAIGSVAVLPILGAIVGYELSNDPYERQAPAEQPTVSISPTASLDLEGKGFTLGIEGTM